jgi:hypothetical protein
MFVFHFGITDTGLLAGFGQILCWLRGCHCLVVFVVSGVCNWPQPSDSKKHLNDLLEKEVIFTLMGKKQLYSRCLVIILKVFLAQLGHQARKASEIVKSRPS